ncbi:peroxiredoxin-like family protein [Myroides sp. WP-1]|uniref:peroxiredoxin-like family protein n=1 Tax=Myroides sp. WP-1 TaxID=2759944 RepID=UPI0015F83F7E|nr:peroxiredoxin-like family protein [Myroides sp. WP-1]MBB1138674.1 AhpC/TSA family protein [Myroides sp. WP-1]
MNTLAQQIDELNKNLTQQVPPEVLTSFGQSIEDVKKLQLEDHCIKVGDTFPNFQLKNTTNQVIELNDLLQKGPAIISFFRGSWCPYCNLELRALQQKLSELEAKKVTLIAISPQLSSYSATLKETLHLDFELLTDQDNHLAKQIGINFELQDYVSPIYQNLGIDLAVYNGNTQQELPIPAVFTLDSTGRVTYKFVDSNYMNRIDMEALDLHV